MTAGRSTAERCALAFVHKRKIMGSLMLAWQTDNYFVFNVSGGGWVAVTDGESSNSVLAYSDSGSLQVGTMPKSTMAWFDVLDKRLEVVGERPRKTKYDRPSIAPLITSEWGQREPYNMFIPMVEDVFHPENGWVPYLPDGDDSDATIGGMNCYGHCVDLTTGVNDTTIIDDIVTYRPEELSENIKIVHWGELTIDHDLIGLGSYSITVDRGGILIIDGAAYRNAKIQLDPEATLIIRNAGIIYLRKGTDFAPPKGTIVSIEHGEINNKPY